MRTLRLLAFTAALGLAVFTSRGAGQTGYQTLYVFINNSGGEVPGVVPGPNGVLYGMTAGLYEGYGSVFELQTSGGKWTETVLYNFTGQNGDGANSWSPAIPVAAPNGAIYGTTTGGGAYGGGTVFELQPPASGSGGTWTETVIYSFPDAGYGNSSNVIMGPNGILYGYTSGAGAYGQGMVFALVPPAQGSAGAWTERELYSFTGGMDGAGPAGLVAGPGGVLYGVVEGGGNFGEGAAFQLNPVNGAPAGAPWTETVLYSFMGGEAGANPFGPPVIGSEGTLYGATVNSVFQLTPPSSGGGSWTGTMIYSFWNEENGGPQSPIIMRDGVIYGLSSQLGGICYGTGGSAFELQKPAGATGGPWTKTVLHQFYTNSEPYGSFVIDNSGALLGTTLGGPGGSFDGFLFKVDPSSAETEASNENPIPDGICGGDRFPLIRRRH
ncbi:MAG: choice-of-anchor tandem repeat GloVer-containing protein [Bryobacteraceae bacterium]|jgi:hypothetical protein